MTALRRGWIRLKAAVLAHVVLTVVETSVALIALLILLWWQVGGNVSGWITNFVVIGFAIGAAEILNMADAFLGLSKRLQAAIVAAALAFAAAGSAAQLVWPGTRTWYLAGLPAIPILVIVTFMRRDAQPDPGAPDFLDGGPWTAP